MDILKTALMEMCRKKKKSFFYPDLIIQEMYPEDWTHFYPELALLIASLLQGSTIELEGQPSEDLFKDIVNRTIKIRCLGKPKS
ncbi:hypothetical protein JYB62_03890 [Algoriphagus lutimaris]|uniref:hypothetical protein n=1 Tax=Algoriphagus lutimaris TaxID=613197 RepID=UPI00196AC521|nr:hypothetical protein [Algoriphagus lutimaris]MBN3519134.1 hypothetical protein [Algoriphagus lutimaris]